eukprot:3884090-Rhodomonas_salina.1
MAHHVGYPGYRHPGSGIPGDEMGAGITYYNMNGASTLLLSSTRYRGTRVLLCGQVSRCETLSEV